MAPFIEVDLLVLVGIARLQGVLDVDNLVPLNVQLAHQVLVALETMTSHINSSNFFLTTHEVSYFFEEVGHLEFVLLRSNVGLDLRVGVVDDGEEHVEEDEEDEEDVQHEVGRSQDAVGFLQFVEVEISEDDSEQSEAEARINQ